MIRVNVKSALYGMQEVLPHFKERGRGHVINVSSMLGRMPFAVFRSAYNGAKHFLNALTANFRRRGAGDASRHPVLARLARRRLHRVRSCARGTAASTRARLPEGQTPDEVADVIAGVIASRKPDVYTRRGARQRVLDYYSGLGEDPS